jgi:hypothetical protein
MTSNSVAPTFLNLIILAASVQEFNSVKKSLGVTDMKPFSLTMMNRPNMPEHLSLTSLSNKLFNTQHKYACHYDTQYK